MSRHYSMLHRVSYEQIINVLREANRPLFFIELCELLPCEPDCIDLEAKLHKMADKGMIKKDIDWTDNCPMNLWYAKD